MMLSQRAMTRPTTLPWCHHRDRSSIMFLKRTHIPFLPGVPWCHWWPREYQAPGHYHRACAVSSPFMTHLVNMARPPSESSTINHYFMQPCLSHHSKWLFAINIHLVLNNCVYTTSWGILGGYETRRVIYILKLFSQVGMPAVTLCFPYNIS